MYGSGMKQVEIVHRYGKKKQHTDCLSYQPVWIALKEEPVDGEVQVAMISTQADTISDLLQIQPQHIKDSDVFSSEHLKDKELEPIILYLKDRTLPD